MTSDGAGNASPPPASGPAAALARLADLDRRIVPVVATRLDRLLPGALGTGRRRRPPLGVRERRILAALAVLLLACAAALTLIGG